MRTLHILAVSVAVVLLMQTSSVQNQLGQGAWNITGLMPSGTITFIDTGSCPVGWTEEAHAGQYLLLTQAANGDVGGTGGSTSYTPAGTNGTVSFTPAGTNNAPAIAWPAGVPTFSGSALATHSHGAGTLTDATSGSTVKLFTASASGVSAATLSGSTAAVTAGTPAGTVAWPAGVPTQSAATFTGSSGTVPAETFTGTSATIQPTFLKLIACKRN